MQMTKDLSPPLRPLPRLVHQIAAHLDGDGGGITSEKEEAELEVLNDWIEAQGLPRGDMSFDYSDAETGEQKAVFDLAWPVGLQEELAQPVAILLNEDSETLAIASQAGFKFFTTVEEFRHYVMTEIVSDGTAA